MKNLVPSNRILTSLVIALAAVVFSTGCSEQSATPNDHGEEHDVVTTVTFLLVGDHNDTTRFVWEDADGPGGNNPDRIDTIRLKRGVAYSGTIQLMNVSVNPHEDLTTDVAAHKEQHQFFYTVTPKDLAEVTNLDKDSNGLSVGLSYTLTTHTQGTGVLEVSLSHFDNSATKDGVTPSDETDVFITMPLVVNN